jgi:NTE family protein
MPVDARRPPSDSAEPTRAGARAGEARAGTKPVALALQGGGAHGAFTWGVLDRLLQEERVSLEAISATSAGTMNAVVMADGFAAGGREEARARLAAFWRAISAAGARYSPLRNNPFELWMRRAGWPSDLTPSWLAVQTMTQLFSPYQLNPLDLDPLREVLAAHVDFSRLRACKGGPELYVSATNVRTGKIKVFETHEITVDAVLASACLPHLFKAVEIDGEHYWDGGFMGNPAIFPLIYRKGCTDVVIVHINPLERAGVPKTASEIADRVNEISFNSSLMREMRAIAFVTRLIDEGRLDAGRYKRMLVHSIRDDAEMVRLGIATKYETDFAFLERLRDLGQAAGERWLSGHYEDIGQRSSIDLVETFL